MHQLSSVHPSLVFVGLLTNEKTPGLLCRWIASYYISGVDPSCLCIRVLSHFTGSSVTSFTVQYIINPGITDRRRKNRENRQIIYKGSDLQKAINTLNSFVDQYTGEVLINSDI